MAIITSKCPHCGAQIVFGEKSSVTMCKYCDSIIAIQSINATPSSVISEDNYKLRNVTAELKYPANYSVSVYNSQGGMIWINPEEIVFKPHKLNLGSIEKSYCKIADICGYKKKSLTLLSIYAKDGNTIKEHTYTVWNKDDIINNVEYYRQKYYKDKGLEIPELIAGSIKPIANGIKYPSPIMKKITDLRLKHTILFLIILIVIFSLLI